MGGVACLDLAFDHVDGIGAFDLQQEVRGHGRAGRLRGNEKVLFPLKHNKFTGRLGIFVATKPCRWPITWSKAVSCWSIIAPHLGPGGERCGASLTITEMVAGMQLKTKSPPHLPQSHHRSRFRCCASMSTWHEPRVRQSRRHVSTRESSRSQQPVVIFAVASTQNKGRPSSIPGGWGSPSARHEKLLPWSQGKPCRKFLASERGSFLRQNSGDSTEKYGTAFCISKKPLPWPGQGCHHPKDCFTHLEGDGLPGQRLDKDLHPSQAGSSTANCVWREKSRINAGRWTVWIPHFLSETLKLSV